MIDERIAIGDPLGSGTARLDRLTLTGWSTALRTWSKHGVMWAVVTSGAVYIYRRRQYDGTFVAGDAVCALTTGLTNPHYGATLSAQNSSGISGTVDVSGTDCIRKVIVSFCDETDLEVRVNRLNTPNGGMLDSSSKFMGGTRFEKPLSDAFIRVAEYVEASQNRLVAKNANNRHDVTQLVEPSRLAPPQALFTAANILRVAHGPEAISYQELADKYESMAYDMLTRTHLAFDVDDDEIVDADREVGVVRLGRG
jgi:hypothetical protein